jgi:hypothetical protein
VGRILRLSKLAGLPAGILTFVRLRTQTLTRGANSKRMVNPVNEPCARCPRLTYPKTEDWGLAYARGLGG